VAAPAGKWFVQLGSFGDIANARKVLDRMAAQGHQGLISPVDTAAGTLYRARLGPYGGREAADAARTAAVQLGLTASQLVQE
jgi:DedD protein